MIRGSVHYIKVGAWQHPCIYGAGGGDSSISSSKFKQEKNGFQGARMRILKPIPTVIYFLYQGHIYSNRAALNITNN